MDGRKRQRRRASIVAGVLTVLLVVPGAAKADSVDDENRFVELINAERSAVGSRQLVVLPELVAGARRQAEAMAAEGRIFHNQNLGDITDGWYLMGENVGRGGNIETLHEAFMDSSGHRENLLNPVYDAVGVGVVWAEGIPYVAEVFMDSIEPVVVASFTPPFRDDDSSVHQADIAALYDAGITKGCGAEIYCPDRPVSRAEMATLMVRAFGLSGSAGDVFSDDDDSEHEGAIGVLAGSGITKGCAPGLYCPDRPVTRAEMATFLVRVLELEPAGPAGFDDIANSEHAAAINALAASGITKGCSATSFCPHHVVTRGQMASFLVRALGG